MSNNPENVRAPHWEQDSFGWSQRCADDAVIVFLAGELDLSTAAELGRRLAEVIEPDAPATIVLDLTGVEFIDTHSIDLIEAAWLAGQRRGRHLQVDGLRGLPAKVFEVLGLEWMHVRRMSHDQAEGHANA